MRRSGMFPTRSSEEPPADLHLHSTCSDGLLSPSAMMREAASAGLRIVALTDHDTVDGLDEAASEARRLGLELIPGLELSCRHPRRGSLHLLAYGLDPSGRELRLQLGRARADREDRVGRIVARLRDLGLEIEEADVRRFAGAAPPARPHVADALVASGQASSRREAFARWLGDGLPGDVARPSPTPEEGIALIRAAGGLPCLAHPPQPAGALIEGLARAGLAGIEVLHPSHGAGHVKILRSLAVRFGLHQTGGSDCHGDEQGLRELRAARVPGSWGLSLLERPRAVESSRSRA